MDCLVNNRKVNYSLVSLSEGILTVYLLLFQGILPNDCLSWSERDTEVDQVDEPARTETC